MSEEQISRRVSISWDELDRQGRKLAAYLREKGTWEGIIAVTRGGLAPAAIVAYELDIRAIDTLCVTSYIGEESREATVLKQPALEWAGDGDGMLVIEDIVDTGQTAKIIRELYPKAFFAAILAKPMGRPYVDKYLVDVAQDTWVDFPWDAPLSLEEKVSP
jgi:xanthine phosphoribosyltransferase